MCIDERTQLATEGIVIAAVDIIRGAIFEQAVCSQLTIPGFYIQVLGFRVKT